MRRVLVFSGPSGVGKTTLLVRLVPALLARGLRVAALKHSGHPHPLDRPGKDSARLRAAGAVAVAVSGPREVAYFGPPVRGLAALARLLPEADVVLAEGFKGERAPRVEVHRRAIGSAFLCERDRDVIAVVSDERPPRAVPWFAPRDVEALADFVAGWARAGRRPRRRPVAALTARAQPLAREGQRSREKDMARTTTKRSGARGKAGRGRRGGATVREAGRKGGRRTLERRGPEFYSRIGRKGGKSSGTSRAKAASRRRGAARTGRSRKSS